MPAPPFTEIDHAGVAPMRLSQSCPQAIHVLRYEDQMNVIIYQASCEVFCAGRRCGCGDQSEIFAPIIIGEEHRQATVSALGHVMWDVRDCDAWEASNL